MFIFIVSSISFFLYGTFIFTQDTYNILLIPLFSCIYELLYSNINLYNLSYNIIYIVSLCQIKVNKLIKKINHFIEHKDNDIIIECFENGKLENCFYLSDYSDINDIYKLIEIYNYNIASFKVDDTIYKCILKNEQKIDFKELLDNRELYSLISSLRFISLNVKYNEENFKINLKDENNNYYIVNNEIDKQFIQYYLEHKLNISTDKDNFIYTIELVDNNVNFINLKDSDSIVIYKDKYVIKN
jgi:hypothetical protein